MVKDTVVMAKFEMSKNKEGDCVLTASRVSYGGLPSKPMSEEMLHCPCSSQLAIMSNLEQDPRYFLAVAQQITPQTVQG
jgi:hypothetical protein